VRATRGHRGWSGRANRTAGRAGRRSERHGDRRTGRWLATLAVLVASAAGALALGGLSPHASPGPRLGSPARSLPLAATRSGQAGILPPANPSANIPPDPNLLSLLLLSFH